MKLLKDQRINFGEISLYAGFNFIYHKGISTAIADYKMSLSSLSRSAIFTF
jgi:hypothetical protein